MSLVCNTPYPSSVNHLLRPVQLPLCRSVEPIGYILLSAKKADSGLSGLFYLLASRLHLHPWSCILGR